MKLQVNAYVGWILAIGDEAHKIVANSEDTFFFEHPSRDGKATRAQLISFSPPEQ